MNFCMPPHVLRSKNGTVSVRTPVKKNVDPKLPREGYTLTIGPENIQIAGGSEAGLFYGEQTLNVIRLQSPDFLPCLEIEDAPDFPLRGILLSNLADEKTLRHLVPRWAAGGINQLQICIRENFPLPRHPGVCADAVQEWDPDKIRRLDDLCRANFMELVPSINSFGHFERFLKRPEYKHLARYPEGGFTFPWGDKAEFGTMLAGDDASFEFVTDIYDAILPCFTSRTVNVGCDETWELDGRYDLYCAFVNRLAKHLQKRGYRVQIWADILLLHPDAIGLLDPDVCSMVWNYNDGYPFEEALGQFTRRGYAAAACPGTSAFLSVTGRIKTARGNVDDSAAAVRKTGGCGLLNTDWTYKYRPLCTGFLPWAHGAAAAWNSQASATSDMVQEANMMFYDGKCPELCRFLERLGNLSDVLGHKLVVDDRSTLYCLYERRFTPASLREYGIGEDVLRRYFREIAELRTILPTGPEDDRRELLHTLDLAELGGFWAEMLLGYRPAGYEELKKRVLADETALWSLHHVPAGREPLLKELNGIMEFYEKCWN